MAHQAARSATAREREAQAFRLRKFGVSYRGIGAKLGVSSTAARKMVKRVLATLEKQTGEDAKEVRRLELERLDKLQSPSLWAKALAGDHKATTALLKIQERRASLLGLDAPKHIEQSGVVSVKVYLCDGEFDPDEA